MLNLATQEQIEVELRDQRNCLLVKLCKFYVAQNSKFNDISKTQQRKRQHLFNKVEKITKNNNPPIFCSCKRLDVGANKIALNLLGA